MLLECFSPASVVVNVSVCKDSNPVLFSAATARLKDWVLVLYGTERNPQQPITSTTTTTSTSAPTTTAKKRLRKHNNPPTSPYFRYDNLNISSRLNKNSEAESREKDIKPSQDISPIPELKKEIIPSQVQRIYYPNSHKPFKNHSKGEMHMCIFETLAKRSNISTRQYYQMMKKKDLSSGKNKSGDLVMWSNLLPVPSS